MTKPEKKRLDQLLKERGLFSSREKAQAFILAGDVLVGEVKIIKPGTLVETDAEIRLKKTENDYVSRGAHKLIAALDAFQVDVLNKTALDVGASTGGFTEVLLRRGIEKVFAIDVGHSQLDWKIRSNPKVVVSEGINARSMLFESIRQKVDVIVIDVSFISLTKVLPNLIQFMKNESRLIALIKPQFEVGAEKIDKGGIVKNEIYRQEAIEAVKSSAETHSLKFKQLIESPITGTKGNQEYLALFVLE